MRKCPAAIIVAQTSRGCQKAGSAKIPFSDEWIKTQSPALRAFHWQNGYGGFSLSPSEVEAVAECLDRQEEHHRTVSFHEEYRKFVLRYGIEYDERYVWD